MLGVSCIAGQEVSPLSSLWFESVAGIGALPGSKYVRVLHVLFTTGMHDATINIYWVYWVSVNIALLKFAKIKS